MQYELYIDVFFLINAIMDWMLLKITGKILSCKVGKMRILWGAFLGSIFDMYCLEYSWYSRNFETAFFLHFCKCCYDSGRTGNQKKQRACESVHRSRNQRSAYGRYSVPVSGNISVMAAFSLDV